MNYALIFGLFSSNFLILLGLYSGLVQANVMVPFFPDLGKEWENNNKGFRLVFKERDPQLQSMEEIWAKHQTETLEDLKEKFNSHFLKNKITTTEFDEDITGVYPENTDFDLRSNGKMGWTLRSPGWKQVQDFLGK